MAAVARGMRCCGSSPRCRACPVHLAAQVRTLTASERSLPAHLAGVPACLHKYEPLFRPPADEETRLPVAS